MRFEVAGVRGQDVRVNVAGSVVRLRGVRQAPSGASIDRLHQMEITFGPFEREILVETPFDAEAVRARLEDGFLEVRIPKRKPTRRTLAIETD